MRDPLPSAMTLDGNLLKFRNPERIRDLLALFSKKEIIEALAAKLGADDPRLSDARMPLVHGASLHDSSVEITACKNQANGYAGLDASSKLTGSQIPYGAAPSTACQGNDSRLLSFLDPRQRIFGSVLPNVATSFTLTSGTAYFVYLGRTTVDLTPKYVEFFTQAGGSGTQTAEVGLFSTPNAPNKAAQTVSKLVATGTVDNMSGSGGLKRNTNAFATLIPAGTHLWAGIRTAMGSTQPSIAGLTQDLSQGQILSCAGSGALTGAGPWTGSLISIPMYLNTTQAPDLRVTLD